MRRVTVICSLALVCVGGSPLARAQTQKTPIEIVFHEQKGNYHQVRIRLGDTNPRLQPIVLLRDHSIGSFRLAVDEQGRTALPQLAFRDDRISGWEVTFVEPPRGPGHDVFAVACLVRERQDWSRSRDSNALQYLLKKATGIEGVLTTLAEFDWMPTGYTFVSR